MINNAPNPSASIITNALIQPKTPLVLTSELDIASLFNTILIKNNYQYSLIIKGVSGIDVVSWPSGISQVSIEIDQSQIHFYINGKPLSNYTCSPGMMAHFFNSNNKSNSASFFNAFSAISFNSQNQYSAQPICPYIFACSKLVMMTINGQTASNNWKFQAFYTNQSTATINSSIQNLVLQGYGWDLDKTLLNPLVFESLQNLNIYNSVRSVQSGLFKYFEQLSGLSFQLDSLQNFFHQVGIDWMMDLKTNLTSVMVSFYDQSALNIYTYPDGDFCLFANLPTQRAIIPILDFGYLTTNCTSTIR
jgi:hypothetical protein